MKAVEVKPNLFRTEGGGYLAFRRTPDGKVVGGTITGSIWDPQSFDRIAWWEDGSLHRMILLICMLVLVSRGVVGLVDAIRRTRGKAMPAAEPIAVAGWRLSGLLPLFLLAGVLCFAGSLSVWRPPITGVPFGGWILLGCLAITGLIAITLPVFAVFAWKDRVFGMVRRIYFSVVAVSAVLFAAVIFYWNLLGFQV